MPHSSQDDRVRVARDTAAERPVRSSRPSPVMPGSPSRCSCCWASSRRSSAGRGSGRAVAHVVERGARVDRARQGASPVAIDPFRSYVFVPTVILFVVQSIACPVSVEG
jgi:hypothetical protein